MTPKKKASKPATNKEVEKKTTKPVKKEELNKEVEKKTTKPVKKEELNKEVEKKVKKAVKKQEIKKEFDDDFSWDSFNDFASSYSDSERKKLTNLYTESLNNIVEKEVIDAIVVGITNRDVVLNVGFKSDGIVPLSEFREFPDLKIGDKVRVYVEEREDIKGQLILSRKKAKLIE